MKTTCKAIILLGAVFFVACTPAPKTTPAPTSEQLLLATVWYQKSAEMRACYYQAYDLAKYKLDANLASKKSEKPSAVVMDIDETILDNSPYEAFLISTGQLYSKQTWKEWTDQARAKALPGAVEFINYAKLKGVLVILISNRKSAEKESTLKNLAQVGIPVEDTSLLFLRGKDTPSCKQSRRDLVNTKFEVLLYIGDNLADYSAVYDERGTDLALPAVDSMKVELQQKFVMLPNPMYGDWEGAIYKNDYTIPLSTKKQLMIEALIK